MQVANPIGLTFQEWSQAFIADNGITLEPPNDETLWREWVENLGAILDGPAIPSPQGFVDWSEWAFAALTQLEEIA